MGKSALREATDRRTSRAPAPLLAGHNARGLLGDRIFRATLLGLGLGILVIAGLIARELVAGGRLALAQFGAGFVAGSAWDPVHRQFGALPMLTGTLLTSLLAMLLAVPVAVAAALFVSEYAPGWLASPVGYLVEMLAAIPSVVYGFWAVFVLVPAVRQLQIFFLQTPGLREVPLLRAPPTGFGLFTAVLILAIMIVPFTAAVARDVLRLVPHDLREAMVALGATKWEVDAGVVLPYARAGIFGGAILSLGRALGETMAVTMVIGNRSDFPSGLFGSTTTMASIIANEFTEATGNLHLSSLIAVGLLLFVLAVAVNLLARLLVRRLTPEGVRR